MMDNELKALEDRSNEDLLQLTLELYSRSIQNPNSEKIHNKSVEAVDELKRRLAQLQGQCAIAKTKELISAIRSMNHAKHHEIRVAGDDEPCYLQRKEWADWILELADEVEQALPSTEELE